MNDVDFNQLRPDGEYLRNLGADVWLMDDHHWALSVWTRFGFERDMTGLSLVHADHHWDGVDDFQETDEERDRLLAANPAEIEAMVRNEEREDVALLLAGVFNLGTDDLTAARISLANPDMRVLRPSNITGI
ncbi:UPF0489 family protein [Paraburkholderia adhaesiva]|uniref:UPF0489 family protein n=1 Tax=Paraburkholderia adhaesiva TaxID=2883244 RepID=UPI001F1D74F2|nr:UPF0489 family protein [Paraburkholderia adhaesiva]